MRHTKDSPRVRQWALQITRQVRYRASKAGTPFNITSKDVLKLWTGMCPCFNRVLRLDSKTGPFSPSLDRLIPGLGYTSGNVAIISVRANMIKQDAIPSELRQVADWLEQTWSTAT